VDFRQLKDLKLEGWAGPFFSFPNQGDLNQRNMTHDVKSDEMETIRLVVPSWCGRTNHILEGMKWTGLIFSTKDGFVQILIPEKKNLSCAVFFQGLASEAQISHYLREISENFGKFREWHRRTENEGTAKYIKTDQE